MAKFPGILLGALIYGVSIAVLFSFIYPTVEITASLGALFGVIGLALAWLTRRIWGLLHRKHRK